MTDIDSFIIPGGFCAKLMFVIAHIGMPVGDIYVASINNDSNIFELGYIGCAWPFRGTSCTYFEVATLFFLLCIVLISFLTLAFNASYLL